MTLENTESLTTISVDGLRTHDTIAVAQTVTMLQLVCAVRPCRLKKVYSNAITDTRAVIH